MLFSIIIPVYEQWHLVPALLECLQKQTISQAYCEILLVDNGSGHFLPPDNLPDNVSIFLCLKPGSYAARNLGASHAQGQWLVFTDADCLPEPAWLASLAHTARTLGTKSLLAGAVRMFGSSGQPTPWEMFDLVKGIPQEWYVRQGMATTANLAVSRRLFDVLGGFDEQRFSGGDADFCRRAIVGKAQIVYVQNAQIRHPARTTRAEAMTKARRLRGAHLTSGSIQRKLRWHLRTLLPPFPESRRLLGTTAYPIRFRLWAVQIQWRIWLMDIVEMIRLALGKMPERR